MINSNIINKNKTNNTFLKYYSLNFGPQHPSAHGVLRLTLSTSFKRNISISNKSSCPDSGIGDSLNSSPAEIGMKSKTPFDDRIKQALSDNKHTAVGGLVGGVIVAIRPNMLLRVATSAHDAALQKVIHMDDLLIRQFGQRVNAGYINGFRTRAFEFPVIAGHAARFSAGITIGIGVASTTKGYYTVGKELSDLYKEQRNNGK